MQNTVYIGMTMTKGEGLAKEIVEGISIYQKRFGMAANVARVNQASFSPVSVDGVKIIIDSQVRKWDLLVGQEAEHE